MLPVPLAGAGNYFTVMTTICGYLSMYLQPVNYNISQQRIVFIITRHEHMGTLVIISKFIPAIWLWNGPRTGDVNYNDTVRVSKLPVCVARCAVESCRATNTLRYKWKLLHHSYHYTYERESRSYALFFFHLPAIFTVSSIHQVVIFFLIFSIDRRF